MDPLVSVIIPVHNNESTLAEQLDAVAASMTAAVAAEIVIVDNRSSDRSASIAREWAGARTDMVLRVVPAPDKANEPYARNVGASAAKGDMLLFCDGDDAVTATWLSSMVEALRDSQYATGPLETRSFNPDWLAEARGHGLFDELPLLFDSIPFAHGCNIGVRRKTLMSLGGFDERFTAGCDIDLAIRAWKAGIPLFFHNGAAVRYRLRRGGRALYRQGRSYGRIQPMIRLSAGIEVDRHEWWRRAKRLIWLVRKLPRLSDRSTRTRWIWVLSLLDGEVRGSIRYRNASY